MFFSFTAYPVYKFFNKKVLKNQNSCGIIHYVTMDNDVKYI